MNETCNSIHITRVLFAENKQKNNAKKIHIKLRGMGHHDIYITAKISYLGESSSVDVSPYFLSITNL